jgi:hypothetical protein
MFNQADLSLIQQKGIDIAIIQQQIENFKTGFPFMNVLQAAVIGDGIKQIEEEEAKTLANFYDEEKNKYDILKFVPASGAATRMFKALFEYMAIAKETSPSQSNKAIQAFFENLPKFAFFESLQKLLPKNADDFAMLETLLTNKGLDYGSLPKGLLEFHRYETEIRTAVQEQMVDGVAYAQSKQKVRLHFTVSPEHRERFLILINSIQATYEQKYNVQFLIEFSEQKSATDTIAVDLNNEPFRNSNGGIVFRPAGHGALLANLNDLEADIVFIKNIDNVVPDHTKPTMVLYKKALAALLIQAQQKIYGFQSKIENQSLSKSEIEEIKNFFSKELGIKFENNFKDFPENKQLEILKNKLFRPIRVCGMVKNVGEPGGGPFWIANNDLGISLQIVESAQIDLENSKQQNIFVSSSHFNPVDLICTTRNYKGEKYNLFHYRDSKTGFITKKSQNGAELQAQELPGLWNGSMSDWNTIFVEVPLITFNPVKTVNDLLRKEHQV